MVQWVFGPLSWVNKNETFCLSCHQAAELFLIDSDLFYAKSRIVRSDRSKMTTTGRAQNLRAVLLRPNEMDFADFAAQGPAVDAFVGTDGRNRHCDRCRTIRRDIFGGFCAKMRRFEKPFYRPVRSLCRLAALPLLFLCLLLQLVSAGKDRICFLLVRQAN